MMLFRVLFDDGTRGSEEIKARDLDAAIRAAIAYAKKLFAESPGLVGLRIVDAYDNVSFERVIAVAPFPPECKKKHHKFEPIGKWSKSGGNVLIVSRCKWCGVEKRETLGNTFEGRLVEYKQAESKQ